MARLVLVVSLASLLKVALAAVTSKAVEARAQILAERHVPWLDEDRFDEYIQSHQKVLIDFVTEKEMQTSDLLKVFRALERNNMGSISLARVNVDQQPALAKRYFRGCDEEKQVCEDEFPRLLWFRDGQVTRYYCVQHDPVDIFGFAMSLDRPYVTTVAGESEFPDAFNRYLIFRGERASPMYTTLEQVAANRLDSVYVLHIEEPGAMNVSLQFDDHQGLFRSFSAPFVGDEDEGAVDAWLRQHLVFGEEPAQDPVDEDGSTVVVASTFDQHVLRNDVDVFLFVYAPWCGYSKKALPEWSKFARQVGASGAKDVVVAKLNGDANVIDTQEYKFSKFPTFAYFAAGERRPTFYEGPRTAQAFLQFAQRGGHFAQNESTAFFQPKLRGRAKIQKLQRSFLSARTLNDDTDL